MNKTLWAAFAVSLVVLLFSCSKTPTLVGDTSETGNTYITGHVSFANGESAAHTQVFLVPSDYIALREGAQNVYLIDSTNENGDYSFTVTTPGTYNIQAVQLSLRTRFLLTNISVQDNSVKAQDAVLCKPGTITVMLPDSVDSNRGYVYIPGTTIATTLKGNTTSVTLDSVPAGVLLQIAYSSSNIVSSTIIRYLVSVTSGDTVVVQNPAWNYAQNIFINTTPTGANIAANVMGFPLLIKLTSANFDFSQAKFDGHDIRFTNTNGVLLPYEIEHWDSLGHNAQIWVRSDTIFTNNNTQHIQMYWGNSAAVSAENSAMVFDTAAGFAGVWHLNQPGNTTAVDATIHHYQGTPYGMTAASSVPGIVGNACNFDGATSYIKMEGTESGALNFSTDNAYSISAWVLIDTVDLGGYFIVGKSNYQYGLEMFSGKFDFFQFVNNTGWVGCYSPAIAKSWCFLTAVYTGTKQYLYINGMLARDSSNISTSTALRDESVPVTIGRQLNGSSRFFKGTIDEVRLCNKAESADWIRLNYMNQRSDDKLTQWK